MYTLYRFLRNFIRSIASQASPWQIGVGTFFGTLLGFLPIWPGSHGPAPLGFCVLILALIINCHLGSVFLFLALGKLLALALGPVENSIGLACASLAQSSADNAFLYTSLWSNTLWLGKTLLGFVLAPIFGIAMAWVTVVFRVKLMAKLLERRRLMAAGTVANKAWLMRATCWFFGL